jgi:hypothetical protein
MRNKKKRSEDLKRKQEFKKQEKRDLVFQQARQVLSQQILEEQEDDSEAIAVEDIPDNLFVVCNVACPKCGCEQLFENGGADFPEYKSIDYVCRDCRCVFEAYLEILD